MPEHIIDGGNEANFMLAGDAIKERGKGVFVRYSMRLGVPSGGSTAYHKKRVVDPMPIIAPYNQYQGAYEASCDPAFYVVAGSSPELCAVNFSTRTAVQFPLLLR
jgi:hypothetical protein